MMHDEVIAHHEAKIAKWEAVIAKRLRTVESKTLDLRHYTAETEEVITALTASVRHTRAILEGLRSV